VTESVNVECVRDIARFRSLRAEWHELFRVCPDVTPFNSWDWLFSWWQAYGRAHQLRLLLVRVDGSLAGILPLYWTSETSAARARCRVLRLVGDGSFDSDHLGFLINPARQAVVLRQFETWLQQQSDWDALALHEITGDSPHGAAMHGLAANLGLRIRQSQSTCAVLDLPDSFDLFLNDRQPRFRTRIRSLLRDLDQDGLAFEAECTPRDLRKKLRSLFALHQHRWIEAGQRGVFGARAKRLFYAHFATRFARNGWLRLYSLRRGGTYVAQQLCFGSDGTTYLLQEGFDVTDPGASFGQMLRAAVIRHLIASGEARYDFLGGISRHKEDWGAKRGNMVHLIIARKTLRGRLYLDGPEWRERFAVAAKRLLPASLVRSLRRARAE
jgi:CelD/BcsL family acetyltransferase involved in cellulose biosynthesis